MPCFQTSECCWWCWWCLGIIPWTTSLQLGRCWRVRCKVGTRERGKCHLAVLHGSSSMIRNTICSGISLTWQLIKVQLRKQLMTWGNAELHKFILWECLTSRHLWCKNNDHQRGYVMCHVRQYIPIQNSINKDVGPLNWQHPIRWNFWPDKQPSFGFWLAALLIMSWGYIGHIHGINPCGAFSEVTADW